MKEKLINIISKETNRDIFEIKQLINRFPYLEILKIIYLKELKKRDETLFAVELKKYASYISNRKYAYFFINGSNKMLSVSSNSYETSIISTDYFAINNSFSSRDSLGQLAKKLRKARLERISEQLEATRGSNIEESVRKLIDEASYSEALKVLKKINLNNSKKSVYFALQIKYLETILNFNA